MLRRLAGLYPAWLCLLLFSVLSAVAAAEPPVASRGLPTLAPLVNEVTPAVVNISVVTRSPLEDNPLFRDPFFRRFFNLPDRPQRQEQAAGSGVIVDAARGYVLTNHHVIREAEQIIVTLKDRRQFMARLVGADPGLVLLPIEGDPGRLEYAGRRRHDLRTDAVAEDERDSMGHIELV